MIPLPGYHHTVVTALVVTIVIVRAIRLFIVLGGFLGIAVLVLVFFLVVFFRNRGSIAVEDVNVMKG